MPLAVATEDDPAIPVSDAYPRASEHAAVALAARGLRASTVRLPPSVHGLGEKGFVPILYALAREKGVSAYVGEGLQSLAGCLIASTRPASFAWRSNAAGQQGRRAVPRDRRRRRPVPGRSRPRSGGSPACRSKASRPKRRKKIFGWFGGFAAWDVPTSGARTRALLNWAPKEPGLLADIDQTGYFG